MNLNQCRNELRSIITELRNIEAGVRRDFKGIGEDMCANCIDKIRNKYERSVLPRLDKIGK